MAHISSSNGFRQNVSLPAGTARSKDVDKEEALQMEAEALAKLQKERKQVVGHGNVILRSRHGSPGLAKQEHDLMVFPESDTQKYTETILGIDLEKLTDAEMEKLLLDDNFGLKKSPKPLTIPQAPLGNPCASSQLYIQPSFQRTPWAPGPQGPTPCSVLPNFSASYPKCSHPFQNGYSTGLSPMQRQDSIFLRLPQHPPFTSCSLGSNAHFQPRGSLSGYSNTLSPDMAKLFDKIARTSEFLKNGRTNADADLQKPRSISPTMQAACEIDSMNKFDWLDLDPLSKPKVDSADFSNHTQSSAIGPGDAKAKDPWDAVLLEEKTDGRNQLEKINGKSPGATVTRSHSLNIRSSNGQQRKDETE
ncbi:hypothetical protein GDO86_002512, partial [Hymenochirus boettgeri]